MTTELPIIPFPDIPNIGDPDLRKTLTELHGKGCSERLRHFENDAYHRYDAVQKAALAVVKQAQKIWKDRTGVVFAFAQKEPYYTSPSLFMVGYAEGPDKYYKTKKEKYAALAALKLLYVATNGGRGKKPYGSESITNIDASSDNASLERAQARPVWKDNDAVIPGGAFCFGNGDLLSASGLPSGEADGCLVLAVATRVGLIPADQVDHFAETHGIKALWDQHKDQLLGKDATPDRS
jgi:hypothetical protein